jgi:hypothetical protein
VTRSGGAAGAKCAPRPKRHFSGKLNSRNRICRTYRSGRVSLSLSLYPFSRLDGKLSPPLFFLSRSPVGDSLFFFALLDMRSTFASPAQTPKAHPSGYYLFSSFFFLSSSLVSFFFDEPRKEGSFVESFMLYFEKSS